MKFLKNKKTKNIFIVAASLIICLMSIFVGIKIKNIRSDFKIKNSVKQVGELKTSKGKKDNVTYNVKYPRFKNKKINFFANNILKKELRNFYVEKSKTNKKSNFFSDYNSYSFNNGKTTSVCYHILTKSGKDVIKKAKTMSCYEENLLNFYNVFQEDKIKKIIMEIKKEIRNNPKWNKIIKKHSINLDEKISNNVEYLKNFIVKEDSVEFYFNSGVILPKKYDIINVSIPNKNLKDCFVKTYFRANTKEGQLELKNLRNSKKPLIALTFDDGPNKETTEKILDLLEKYNSHATFFVVGKQAKKFPEILKRQAANGHEIANHSFSHKALPKLSQKNMEAEIFKTDEIVEKIINKKPQLLRAPYGSVNNKVKEIANRPLILWSVDTKDWQTRNSQKTIDAVLKNATDGDIVLMHDFVVSTSEAAEKIITGLINRGFTLVTVSEMFDLKNIPLEKGIQYTKAGPNIKLNFKIG